MDRIGRRILSVAGALLLGLSGLTPAASAQEATELPRLRWVRSPDVLTLTLAPARGTRWEPRHILTAGLTAEPESGPPVAVTWKDVPRSGRHSHKVRLPRPSTRPGTDWSVSVRGAICPDAAGECQAFTASFAVPRQGRMAGRETLSRASALPTPDRSAASAPETSEAAGPGPTERLPPPPRAVDTPDEEAASPAPGSSSRDRSE